MANLLRAVGNVINREGFRDLGVNSIAREAGCDKVLIYRYFGSYDGLLDAYFEQNDFYTHFNLSEISENVPTERENLKRMVKDILRNQLFQTIANPGYQEVLRWELVDDSKVLQTYASRREASGHALTKLLSASLPASSADIEAMIAILVSGLYYLVLRSKYVKIFNGVSLDAADGWERISSAVDELIDCTFDKIYSKE
ncbi:MAG: TetR/AcrR family transcriptional regulator [Bacteroidales bacterium]|nr:TetR/AcrR family transcriptional regulator [Bacteroidales bacterium]